MKKYIVSILAILLLITSITSVTYAWFTYVQKKSLATFDAGVLSVSMFANNSVVVTDVSFNDLAYVDFQKDVIDDQTDTFDMMASANRVDIKMGNKSPRAINVVTLEQPIEQTGLLYMLIYEGVNIDASQSLSSNYRDVLLQAFNGTTTKNEQIAALTQYNQSVLDTISNTVLTAGESITFQIIAWGDYDELAIKDGYLGQTFDITFHIIAYNDKAEVN